MKKKLSIVTIKLILVTEGGPDLAEFYISRDYGDDSMIVNPAITEQWQQLIGIMGTPASISLTGSPAAVILEFSFSDALHKQVSEYKLIS